MSTRASLIDDTLLDPAARKQQIDRLCHEADELGMASVCVNPVHVPHAVALLSQSSTLVCTVIDFPFGASSPHSKAAQTRIAIEDGADEVDMVVNIGAVKDHDWEAVEADINGVVTSAPEHTVKVILETGLLDDEEIRAACKCAERAGAKYVKTSTGYLGEGATVHAVSIMNDAVGGRLGIKASGGIRTPQQMDAMIQAGATRIGASAGRKLLGRGDRA
ncbi:deoxyribose-phosphate aldolase [Actinomyces glycerinitolerans]|uniref:Deoxyribose-phosphate aldolase n=1 Tax=Actinomyces glycerinitolerans TaxID=1892869 RepID=A0A1M4RZP7_9ACTO|nr:deoxyribose-phosphate aldolase [Actinomyces glycerinitolerans]SHE25456.1 deoc/fbab/ lacd aldolase [Actinomyces glycerinitolerans]